MPIFGSVDAFEKGHKLAAEGLSLFDTALEKLHLSNEHLERHAAETKTLIEGLTEEHTATVDKIVKNKGVVGRLEALLSGDL